jgi:hypothetical protein
MVLVNGVPALAAAHRYGGGPGDFAEPHDDAVAHWTEYRQWLADRHRTDAEAAKELAATVTKVQA